MKIVSAWNIHWWFNLHISYTKEAENPTGSLGGRMIIIAFRLQMVPVFALSILLTTDTIYSGQREAWFQSGPVGFRPFRPVRLVGSICKPPCGLLSPASSLSSSTVTFPSRVPLLHSVVAPSLSRGSHTLPGRSLIAYPHSLYIEIIAQTIQLSPPSFSSTSLLVPFFTTEQSCRYLHLSAAPLHRHQGQHTTASIMHFSNVLLSGAVSLLSLSTLTQAVAIPQPATDMTERATSGYRNVAYFVNWVSVAPYLAIHS
jgi:hypothetical protein